jgi:vitamin B12 transporter
MKYSIKLSIFLLLTTSTVFAEELIVLDEITVTAGYTDTGITETGASVSVLEEKELQYSSSGIVQAFENVAGVSMDTTGGLGALATISVRGLKQQYIGVRFNGMDITDPSGTQLTYDFGSLNGMGLGQVEFVKGSQSAIFGSEAVGGVINLKTLSSNEEGARGQFTADLGSNETYSSSLSYEKVDEKGSAAVFISRAKTAGFSAKKTGAGANEVDPYSGNQISVSFDRKLKNNLNFSLSALKSAESISYDGDFTPLTDTIDRDTTVMRGSLAFNLGATSHEVGITNGDFKRVYSFGTYDSDRRDVEYKGEAAFSGISFTFGAHRSEETIDAVGTTGDDTEGAYFLEANTSITDELEISATARQTDSDDFGSNTSYRTAAIYRLNNGVAFRTMVSSGFRAPSLYERYGAFGAGNINLKPEESGTQEIGVEKVYQSGSSVRVTIFNTNVDNLIEYDMGTFSYTQATNSRKSQGVEFEGKLLAYDRISFDGSYAYVDAKTGTEVAARVPKHDLSLSISANISPKINSNLEINHIMDYKDTVSGSLVDMPDYTVTNLAVSYDMPNNLMGYVRIQDLMDTDYETVKDFNTGGRQIFAGIRATF